MKINKYNFFLQIYTNVFNNINDIENNEKVNKIIMENSYYNKLNKNLSNKEKKSYILSLLLFIWIQIYDK
jgi:hypothetical protein